ncbi:uncharacterized protein B0H18DRAFT_952319 [Fomitopsis serialis]|uniref:uncharacterized protein n=1 Tax=Fomitopsis serialis TaxID=139415 RepID=UPI002008DEAB|nr:uncharacterized protein B0H18DRAFT_952319 [Neoantrodia serialis]KAH9932632.1 hypothetical protein B0H18DRAFT_952319 [Neoantrodia serialis]
MAQETPEIVEVMVLDVNDGVSKDSPAFETLRQGAVKGGLVHQSYGFAVKNPKKLYWLPPYVPSTHFDQGFQPKDFQWPAEYGEFSEAVKELATSEPESHFCPSKSSPGVRRPRRSLRSLSLTGGQATVTLKPDVDIDTFAVYQETLTDALNKEPAFRGVARSLADPEKRTVWVFVGWDSAEAHASWAKANAGLLETFIQSMESGGIAHVQFVEHVQ